MKKFMKEWYTSKRQIILNLFSIKFWVGLEKDIVHSMLYFQIMNFMEKFIK